MKTGWGELGEYFGINNGRLKRDFTFSSALIFLRIGWLPSSILLFPIFPKKNF
jgi:hypothetical protein